MITYCLYDPVSNEIFTIDIPEHKYHYLKSLANAIMLDELGRL